MGSRVVAMDIEDRILREFLYRKRIEMILDRLFVNMGTLCI